MKFNNLLNELNIESLYNIVKNNPVDLTDIKSSEYNKPLGNAGQIGLAGGLTFNGKEITFEQAFKAFKSKAETEPNVKSRMNDIEHILRAAAEAGRPETDEHGNNIIKR